MQSYRVIQWTTGKVGKLALRAILDDPRLELAGVYAYSGDKCGRDAGELCNRPHCGVRATNDLQQLLDLNADVVIYTPFMADLDHLVTLLASGLNVVSTNLLLNIGGVQGEVKAALEAACEKGQSSLYITGINPGWVNSFTAHMTAVCRQVDCVTLSETANCAVYESAETWQAMGMAQPEASEAVMATVKLWMTSFYDSVQRLAKALAFELEETEFCAEFATASEDIDLGWFHIPKDTNAAVRAGWQGKIKGRTVVHSRVTWYLTEKLNQGWQFDDEHYHISISGEPNIKTTVQFIPPEHWGHGDWDTMTALPAVNAVAHVVGAAPGILTLEEAGLVCLPAGIIQP